MFEYYIKKIHIGQVRHLKDVDIPICEDKCRHLILTGRNGSGKTSLLMTIEEYLDALCQEPDNVTFDKHWLDFTYPHLFEKYPDYFVNRGRYGIIKLEFNISHQQMNEQYNERYKKTNVQFVAAFFSDDRKFLSSQPKMIEKVELKEKYAIWEKPRELFVKYLLDMKMTEALSKNNSHPDKALLIGEWFDKLEKLLQRLFSDNELKLIFDEDTFEFKIKEPGGKLFDFNTMSAGYAAAFDIIVDLMMRMEKNSNRSFRYDMPGIVLIDEIETHLHLELQKLILPMLTKLFPNIQFVVTTHSPFVLNSIEKATVYDLENHTLIQSGLSDASYSGIVEGYFNQDELSHTLREKLECYKALSQKAVLTDDDYAQLAILETSLDEIPDYIDPGIATEYKKLKTEFRQREAQR